MRSLSSLEVNIEQLINAIIALCDKVNVTLIITFVMLVTAVKSNALAELMNRASKIRWKNFT